MDHFSTFTFHWKDATPLDESAREIASFLFPEWKCMARLKSENVLDSSWTLWRDPANLCVLVYVTNNFMNAQDVLLMLNALEGVETQGGFDSRFMSTLSIHLFASGFEERFISKLRFLVNSVRTYEWLSRRKDQKEIVFVKERNGFVKPEPIRPQGVDTARPSSEFPLAPLSGEEITAFVELDQELRKTRSGSLPS